MVAFLTAAVADAAAQGVTLSVSPATLAEDAGTTDVTVTATLSAARTVDTTVSLSLGGTARTTDYTVLGSTPSITIPANQTSADATLVVSPVDDSFYEKDESVTVNGSAGSLTVTGASLTLSDTETQPTLTISFPRLTRTEGQAAGTNAGSVTLTGAVFEDDVSVRVRVAQNSSASSADYTTRPSLPTSFTLDAGEQSVTLEFTLSAVDDNVVESREELYVDAEASYRGSTFRSSSLLFRIQDNDSRIAQLLPDPQGVYRGESTSVTALVRIFEPVQKDVTIAVNWEPASWFVPNSVDVTIPAGETSTTATFTVTPPSGSATTVQAQMTSSQEDELRLRFQSIHLRVWPTTAPLPYHRSLRRVGGGDLRRAGDLIQLWIDFSRPFELLTGRLTFSLDSGTVVSDSCSSVGAGYAVTCRYQVQKDDYDYDSLVEIAPGGLAFTWRDERDSSITWPVPTVPPSTQTVSLGAPVYGGDEAIDLSVSPQTLQEGVGATSLTVRALDATLRPRSTSLTVPFVFRNGTTSPADYVTSGVQSVTIPAGQIEGSTTVTFTPVDDFVKENRVETVRIEANSSMPSIFGRAAELRILDAPSIVLSAMPRSVSEDGGAQTVTVTAALADATDQVRPRAIPVTLTFGGSAVEGDDFSVTGETVVTIPANARSGTTTLTLTPVDDLLLEMDETIAVNGSTPGLPVSGTSLTLTDDEVTPEVVLAVDDETVLESETGGSAVTVTATLDPSVMVSADVEVTLDLGGTATEAANGDYTASWSPSNRQITIPAGSDAGSAGVTLTLTPQQDTAAEGDETIVVQGTAVVQDTAMGALTVQVATVTLQDDDTAGVVVAPQALAVPEGGSGTYTVVLVSQPTADVTVGMTTALADTDLTVAPAALTFAVDDWDTAQTVTVTAAQDADPEDDEVTLEHTASGGGYESVAVDDVVVTVTDDDDDVTVSVAAASGTEGSAVTFTAELSRAVDFDVALRWSTGDDEASGAHQATSGTDYTAVTADSVTVAAGDTEATFSVSTTQDTDTEGDETFAVTVTGTSLPAWVTIPDGTAVGTIEDDDAATVSVATAAATEGSDVTFTVELSTAVGSDVVLGWSTGDDDTSGAHQATSGTDYTAVTAGRVTISAGNTEATFAVTTTQDTLVEEDETFAVTVVGVTLPRGVTVDAATAVGTISDDDTPDFTIAVDSASIAEDGGTSTVTVSSGGVTFATDQTITLTLTGTATQGTDYTIGSESLTLEAGETSVTTTVTGVDDPVDDDGETVVIEASRDGNAVGTSQTVTITDDDERGLGLSESSLNFSEGNSASYTVVLSSEPTATVTVTLGGTAGTDLTLDKTSLTFTTSTWDTEQTVTVSAGQDDDAVDDPATLTHTASGGDYAGETADLPVTVDDDESVGIVLAPTSLTPNEGANASYTVALASEPTATVTVAISGQSGTDLTLDKTSLTFTTATWDTEQTVTVTVGSDDDAVDDTATLTHTASGGDYAGETADLPVTVDDDEAVGIVLAPTSLNPNEGASASYTVALALRSRPRR